MDFIESLLTKRRVGKKRRKPELSWIGGLREYLDIFIALELQRISFKWRDLDISSTRMFFGGTA